MAPNGIDQPTGMDLPTAERWCRRLARSHYENFLVASVLLPRIHRQPMYNVYAFCRTADDFADESTSPAVATERLDQLQQQLDATFAGSPPANMFLALADTIERYGLTKPPFDDLLAAFQQDQYKNRYESRSDLLDYCQCSANPVGQLVLQIAGCDDDARRSLSDEICTGLQLANFCQDVARDYQIGRIYLAQEDWPGHGVTESMFAESSTQRPLRDLVAEYCDLAESMLCRGLPLCQQVPNWLAKDIKLFVHGGLATVQAVRGIQHDVMRTRPTVGKFEQFKLLGQAVLGRLH
tara:strand:+ start:11221 stop:12102 length:882 start_codon:yes stop_codon:yes gene_type:complete